MSYLQRLMSLQLHELIAHELEQRFGVEVPTRFVRVAMGRTENADWSDSTWFMFFKHHMVEAGLFPVGGLSVGFVSRLQSVPLHVGFLQIEETLAHRRRLLLEFEQQPKRRVGPTVKKTGAGGGTHRKHKGLS